jgi:DNA primase large subunit
MYNGKADFIILFPFYRQSNRVLLEGRTWVLFRGILFLKEKSERRKIDKNVNGVRQVFHPEPSSVDELNLAVKTENKGT